MNFRREDVMDSYCGSIEYMAPEVKNAERYDFTVDYYTLGALAYEMVMGMPPYYRDSPMYFTNCSPQFVKMVNKLVDNDARQRIRTFKELR